MSGLDEKARDWTEDSSHENGNYMSRCTQCGHPFTGYKRRVVCKVCASATPADVGEEPAAWEGYWPGAGSISSEMRLTRYLNKAEEWKRDGAEVCPLYSAAALERVARERELLRGSVNNLLKLNERATAKADVAEAKLAEAREVIERIRSEAGSWAASYSFARQIADIARRFLEETK